MTMARYMIQSSYAKETAAKLVQKPEDRSVIVGEMIEKLGGRLLDSYFAFGDYDGVLICEIPDNVTTLALVMAATAPGHVAKLKTTVLLTPQESLAAMKKAGTVTLRPPGA
jgi:uncharacterized protein with GYD domain